MFKVIKAIDEFYLEGYSIRMKSECIVLIGMAGAGKSTIGDALAKILGYAFTDLDIYISEKGYNSIQAIIDNQGEAALLKLEKEQMYKIDLQRRVISPGGSIIYHPDLMLYLKERAVLVYLDEEFSTIEKRISNASARGIVGLRNRSLREIYEERCPLYNQFADIVVKSGGKNLDEIVRTILQEIQEINL